jgi:hypothetical protein
MVVFDPAVFLSAAGRVDQLFDNVNASLEPTDRSIKQGDGAWVENAAKGFPKFVTYLDGRRNDLKRDLAGLAADLRVVANTVTETEKLNADGINTAGAEGFESAGRRLAVQLEQQCRTQLS